MAAGTQAASFTVWRNHHPLPPQLTMAYPSACRCHRDSVSPGVIPCLLGCTGAVRGWGTVSVYQHWVGDVWARIGRQAKWTYRAMVSARPKGWPATVIHRLVDLCPTTRRCLERVRAQRRKSGHRRQCVATSVRLAHLRGGGQDEVDHLTQERRLPLNRQHGKLAYHAVTYGWLLSGLARAVTGKACVNCSARLARPTEPWYSLGGGSPASHCSHFHLSGIFSGLLALFSRHPVVAARRCSAVPRR